ncbi:hypothetical protein Tco_0387284 [Tanacetum coccineum]
MQERLTLSKIQGAFTPADVRRMQRIPYASAIRSIMYAVRNTKDMFFIYGGDLERELIVIYYTDVGSEADIEDKKFQTGYVFVLKGGVVDGKSAKKFIYGLGVVPTNEKPMEMYCDNSSATIIANEPGVQRCAGHIKRKFTTFESTWIAFGENTRDLGSFGEGITFYYDSGWNDPRDFVKPVKEISLPPNTSKTPDRRLLKLEDQIKFLLKGSQTAPLTSPTHIPWAYVKAVSSDPHPQNLNEPPRQSSFTFQKHVCPDPQPQALETSFEARVRDYMAAHTKRMERLENAIFKQREEINDRISEMFGILKELTASRTLEKNGEEKSVRNNGVVSKNIIEPSKSIVAKTLEEVDRDDEVTSRTNDDPVRSTERDLTGEKVRELVEAPRSQPVKFYLKHKINKELIEGLVGNPRFNNSLRVMQSGKMECEAYHSLPVEPLRKAMLKKMIAKKEDMGETL